MPKTIDIPIGTKFGRLTVTAKGPVVDGGQRWLCTCLCGATRSFSTGALRHGVVAHRTVSCGAGCGLGWTQEHRDNHKRAVELVGQRRRAAKAKTEAEARHHFFRGQRCLCGHGKKVHPGPRRDGVVCRKAGCGCTEYRRDPKANPWDDREFMRVYQKAWALKHKKRLTAYYAEYYKDHSDIIKGRVAAWRRNNPERVHRNRVDAHMQNRYHLTRDQYHAMFVAQSGLCAVCGLAARGKGPAGTLSVDHDHKTGEVRALLCHQCNRGIGGLRDDPVLLMKAAWYLDKHRNKRRLESA